jgi:hypothetical protein
MRNPTSGRIAGARVTPGRARPVLVAPLDDLAAPRAGIAAAPVGIRETSMGIAGTPTRFAAPRDR